MDTIEQTIIESLLKSALEGGLYISVHDDLDGGGDWTVERSRNYGEIFGALDTTEGDTLRFTDESGQLVGHVWLIWGNGPDLVHDWTVLASSPLPDMVERAIKEGDAKMALVA